MLFRVPFLFHYNLSPKHDTRLALPLTVSQALRLFLWLRGKIFQFVDSCLPPSQTPFLSLLCFRELLTAVVQELSSLRYFPLSTFLVLCYCELPVPRLSSIVCSLHLVF